MTLENDVKATNGADKAERGGMWSRVESARGALLDTTRNATQVATRSLDGAQRRVVGTVRAKPVTTSAAVAGLALLAAAAVFLVRNPKLLKQAAKALRR